MLPVVAVLGGLGLGAAMGGSVHGIVATRFRAWALVAVAAGLQLAALRSPVGPLGLALLLLSNAGVGAFVFLNRGLVGMGLIGLGLVLNLSAIVANAGMPVAPEAARAAVGDSVEPAAKHHRLKDTTLLPWLGDVIPVPPLQTVVSVGDVLLLAGIVRLVSGRMMVERKPAMP